MSHDLCIVGAGLTAATICSVLKKRLKILVLDVRPYVGGNCHDYRCGNTYVHMHGPHNYHSPNERITKYLGQYTTWVPFDYRVQAEVLDKGEINLVPFPITGATEVALGRNLSQGEIVELFFKRYSEKMWGCKWDEIPESIKARVPQRSSSYYPNDHFQALPSQGYTHMMENMFDGVEIELGVGKDLWRTIDARRFVYCGRLDKITDVKVVETLEYSNDIGYRHLPLQYRDLSIQWLHSRWSYGDCHAVNFCSHRTPWTRTINWSLYGDRSCPLVSIETPIPADSETVSPYYTVPTASNLYNHQKMVESLPPNVFAAGRIGTYRYLDMWQAVDAALTLSEKLISHD